MYAIWLRWNYYKNNVKKFQRNESCMQQHLYEHFHSEGHTKFLENVSGSLTNKTDGFQLKKGKLYWMRTLKTLAPSGLNVESAVRHFISQRHVLLLLLWIGLFFRHRTLDTFVILYSFCVCITPVTTVSASFGDYLIDQQCKQVIWMLYSK